MDKKTINKQKIKVIIDYDGTLTQEEKQVNKLAELAFDTLSKEILNVPKERVRKDYKNTKQKILAKPYKYTWKVNGISACYSDEGAFVLNTVTIQEMLSKNKFYKKCVEKFFDKLDYDPITECTNYLFNKNSALLKPIFRNRVKGTLIELIKHQNIQPIVMTNSKTNKVRQNLETIGITKKGTKNHEFEYEIDILGDTRQYHMDPKWNHYFDHPELGKIQILPIYEKFKIDLRRPIYYKAILDQSKDGSKLIAFGDIFSLVGSVPLMMGQNFILLKAPYVPEWSEKFVRKHPKGRVITNISQLIMELEKILNH
jgi:histidinol phosphatase-like enzyme